MIAIIIIITQFSSIIIKINHNIKILYLVLVRVQPKLFENQNFGKTQLYGDRIIKTKTPQNLVKTLQIC